MPQGLQRVVALLLLLYSPAPPPLMRIATLLLKPAACCGPAAAVLSSNFTAAAECPSNVMTAVLPEDSATPGCHNNHSTAAADQLLHSAAVLSDSQMLLGSHSLHATQPSLCSSTITAAEEEWQQWQPLLLMPV